jgi:integrase
MRDFDPKAGTLRINKSRSEGEENEPKTERSKRTIRLRPEALEVLRAHHRSRLMLDPDAYLFVNPEGQPINHKEWPRKSFYPVLRKLGIRLRDFYSTRDTFISEMLRRGENVKAIGDTVERASP